MEINNIPKMAVNITAASQNGVALFSARAAVLAAGCLVRLRLVVRRAFVDVGLSQ